ncbi:PAAR domain-containing protein [Robbsia sp. KACC 23696]|uniref:PAAR domain-containing protein n=1 Tax=Robbsia sp. KACC 23696 TaxID=3149231 RepID=UPI00325B316C
MGRKFIRKNDKTDCNGIVLDGVGESSFTGQPLSYIGAPVSCPACHSQGVIISDGGQHTVTMMGKQVALENDLCQCKCTPLPKLVASQDMGSLSG